MSLLRLFKLFGSDSSKYANVLEANTARTTGTIVVATQNIDQTGKVPPAGDAVGNAPFVKLTDGTNTAAIDAANTARTTGTKVQAVQLVDSTGKVPPAGEVYTNPIYTASRLVDELGAAYGVKHISNKPRVSSMPYLYDIAEGNVAGHEPFEKIGYSLVTGTTVKDVWSYTDTTINLPTTGTAMEVYTNNAQDLGTVIRGPLTADAGGSTTSLVDASEDFTAATAVAIGDLVILDKAGTTPEYGFVTGVSATTLTISGGFSKGGTAASREYYIVDTSATSGAHAVRITYLTTAFAEKSEIIICGGNATGVNLVNTDVYRVNSMRVISLDSGTGIGAAAAIQLQDADGTAPIYSYITAGYTRARNSIYTVPAGKTLYICQLNAGYVTSTNQVQNDRIILKATQDAFFRTNCFQAQAEILCANATGIAEFILPLKIMSGVDIKFTAVPTANGQVTTVLRGWIE